MSLGWVEGRGQLHLSPRSPAGVRFRFSFSSVFSWGEGRFQATAWALPVAALWPLRVAALKQQGGRQWWRVLPEQEHPAHRWRLGRTFNGGDGSGSASQLQQKSQLELGNCTRLSRFDTHQRA